MKINHPATKTFDKLFHFSEEEAYILYHALEQIKGSGVVKERLVKKLHALYDFKALKGLEKTKEIEIVTALGKAIQDKRRVILKEYRSSNSETIEDREVEPFAFTEDYLTVWCYEIEANSNKQFRISRMKDVDLLPALWQYESAHQVPFTEFYRLNDLLLTRY